MNATNASPRAVPAGSASSGARWPWRLAAAFGLLMLMAMVWLVGPLLAVGDVRPLESQSSRLVAIATLLGIGWGSRWMLRQRAPRLAPPRFDIGDIALGLTALALTAALLVLGRSYLAARAHVQHMADVAAELNGRVRELTPQSPLSDLSPLLDVAREAARESPASLPPVFGIGLDKGPMLAAAAGQTYRHLLNNALLPRVVKQLTGRLARVDSLPALGQYELLKTYLALADQKRIEPGMVRVLTALLAPRAVTGAESPWAAALPLHLDAMLAESPIPPVVPDEALVAATRQRLAALPMSELVRQRVEAQIELRGWSVVEAAGPASPQAFELASGDPLSNPLVEGRYRREVRRHWASRVDIAAEKMVAEAFWVLGDRAGRPSEPEDLKTPDLPIAVRVAREATTRYEQDYINAWRTALTKIRVVRLMRPDDATGNADALTASALQAMAMDGASPLVRLARSVADETSPGALLTRSPASSAAASSPTAGLDMLRDLRSRSRTVSAAATQTAESASTRIDDAFAPLHRWVGPVPAGTAPVDATQAGLRSVYERLLAEARDDDPARASATTSRVTSAAIDATAAMPPPFGGLVRDALRDAHALFDAQSARRR